jgi:hypothetical protein
MIEVVVARLDVPPEAVEFAYGKNGKPGLAQRYADSGWRFPEYPIARMLPHSRVQRIYAGSNEIIKELIAWSR